MTLALVRHGRTAWNAERRMQGRTDVPLDACGREQAAAAGRLLAQARWARVVSSPLARARETAEIIAAALVPDAEREPGIALDADLVERHYGRAEGLLVAEARERWPEGDFEASEPLAEVAARARRALGTLAAQPGGSVVVAHGTLLRVGIEELTGSPCPRVLNGQVVLLDPSPAGFVARFLGG
ncbi:histidine phosphatase family protein [Microbacterium sp. No. 7]|uniref:histidine phosphatase family protein n=1 Tax=Microbacterium sp. No. 7 TaxID=1714373 RepID=UPI0006D1C52B|nr:histidine phosphatase family protein [Microbacterium sp. No. 7]ALJ22119.1 hypothetical protein AOA12_20435 [Microbacterium sp. No. 7]